MALEVCAARDTSRMKPKGNPASFLSSSEWKPKQEPGKPSNAVCRPNQFTCTEKREKTIISPLVTQSCPSSIVRGGRAS